MSTIEINFFSRHLQMYTTVSVLIPRFKSLRDNPLSEVYNPEKRFKTLYLLHGAGGDYSYWKRYSSVDRYIENTNLAVIMPSAYNSCYADMAHGVKYFSFLSEELPLVMQSTFPLSDKSEDRYVAGLSMGGRGAFLWALKRPDFFRAAACLSGSLDVNAMIKRMKASGDQEGLRRFTNVFGELDRVADLENNVYLLARKLAESGAKIPKLLCACGTEDMRLQEQQEPFLKYAEEISLPIDSFVAQGGHGFDFWDPAIERVIKWLPMD